MKPSKVIAYFLAQGLTMYRIAKVSGLGTGTLARIVHEKQKDITLSTLKALAQGLGTINPHYQVYFWILVSLEEEKE